MEQQSITYFFPITARVASAKPCLKIDTPDAMHTRKKKVFFAMEIDSCNIERLLLPRDR